MAKKESKGRFMAKGALKLLSGVCVNGAVAGITASVVPLTMINPIVGGIIVVGSMIASSAACDRVVNGYIDKEVDDFANKIDPLIESAKLINRAKEIYTEKGEQPTREFMKNNGFDKEQIDETIKQFKKKQ